MNSGYGKLTQFNFRGVELGRHCGISAWTVSVNQRLC